MHHVPFGMWLNVPAAHRLTWGPRASAVELSPPGRPVALKHDGSPFDKNRLNFLLLHLTNPCFSKSEKLWIISIKGDSVEVQVWRKSSSFEMIQSDVAETSVDPRVSRNSEVSCVSP